MRNYSAALAIVAACALCTAAAQEQPAARPFVKLEAGQAAQCHASEGCVAMSVNVFRAIVQQAIQRGAQACKNST